MKSTLLYMILSVIGLCGCNSTSAQKQSQATGAKPGKSLVVFFSWGGNTRTVAEQIARQTGADLFELQPKVPYTTDSNELEELAKRQVQEKYKPELVSFPQNLEQYDIIYIGSPCWFATFAPPVRTFLASTGLAGKKIMPFMTHAGSGSGKSVREIREIVPEADVADGLPVYGTDAANAGKEIAAWLKKNQVTK